MPTKAGAARRHNGALAALLHELNLHDDAAELRRLIELCRESARVRTWLFSRFASEPAIQDKFRDLLRRGTTKPTGLWSPLLEAEVLSAPDSKEAAAIFGGLTQLEVWALIREYGAEGLDPLAFVLVRLWRQISKAARPVPAALWQTTLAYWQNLTTDGSGREPRQFTRAVAFFNGQENGDGPPPSESWRLHILFHILDHPQPTYRVGELYAALPAKFRRSQSNGNPLLGRRAIRKFCEQHGIRRDQRPGAPKRTKSR